MPHKDPEVAKLYFASYHKKHQTKKLAYSRAYYRAHKARCNENARRWNEKNPEKRKKIARDSYHRRKEQYVAYRRHYRTGCDLETYNQRWAEQNGLCAICGSPPFRKHLDADHDHLTGKIRGLLCNRCNTALGNFQEEASILQKAIEYLERWE